MVIESSTRSALNTPLQYEPDILFSFGQPPFSNDLQELEQLLGGYPTIWVLVEKETGTYIVDEEGRDQCEFLCSCWVCSSYKSYGDGGVLEVEGYWGAHECILEYTYIPKSSRQFVSKSRNEAVYEGLPFVYVYPNVRVGHPLLDDQRIIDTTISSWYWVCTIKLDIKDTQ